MSLYLKTAPDHRNEAKIKKLDVKWDSRIGIDVAEDSEYSDEAWHHIQNTTIKLYVKVFTATTLINTTLLIAYNNVVSSFDIIKKLWLDHYIMDE